jgi:hypothetical protein
VIPLFATLEANVNPLSHAILKVTSVPPTAKQREDSPGVVQPAQDLPEQYEARQSVPLEPIGDGASAPLAAFLASGADSYLKANTIMADSGSGLTR